MAEKTKEEMMYRLTRQLNNIEQGMLSLLMNAPEQEKTGLFEHFQRNLREACSEFVVDTGDQDGCPKGQRPNEEGICEEV